MKILFALPVFTAMFFLAACQKEQPAPTLFTRMDPGESGLDFRNEVFEDTLMNSINNLYFYDGGGVAIGDVNGDDLPDIYLTANLGENHLYLNRGGFRFEDVTARAGVGGGSDGWSTGTAMADLNGDGLLDIYVCRAHYLGKKGPNQLFINNGDGTFSEKAADLGLDFTGLSRQAAFLDYDRDGDLDIYLMNHSVHGKGTYGEITHIREKIDPEVGDQFFENRDGQFVNVTEKTGIYSNVLGYGLGVGVSDFNGDGYPDLYICNDFHEDDYLYYNNGDGTFTEGLRQSMGHTSLASMGNDIADFNNDLLPDVMVLDMLPPDEATRKNSVTSDLYNIYNAKLGFGYYHQLRRNTLQLNRGPAYHAGPLPNGSPMAAFSEIGQLAGVSATDWSWSTLFADLDNDGYRDLLVTNGIYRRLNDLDFLAFINLGKGKLESGGRMMPMKPRAIALDSVRDMTGRMPSEPLPNFAFRANGDLTFENRAEAWGLAQPTFSSGAAYADLDNDGDLDLVINNVNGPAGLFRNDLYDLAADSGAAPAYLAIKLKGRAPNHFGVGARVVVATKAGPQMAEQWPVRGFQSSVSPVLHLGLGQAQKVDRLTVTWPDGTVQELRDVAVNQTVVLDQQEAAPAPPARALETPLWKDVSAGSGLDFRHEENTFIEFNREPFIPRYVSTEGPALAVGDLNRDGLDDLFFGGGKFQEGALFRQKADGSFRRQAVGDLESDARSEDVDALFFDANGDGWQDLYVVSGGNEFFGQADPLLDRLYLNDGRGNLERAPDALPRLFNNGSCVAAADLDGDGDVDLFAGSRSVPRAYGEAPASYLLLNDGKGNFRDATAERAPMLTNLGLVSDALWQDLNGDRQPDLVVVGEWMPVTVLINQNGTLRDATAEWGLSNSHGWWNHLDAADFNGDGKVDLVAGNLGLNSMLQASPEQPVQLFINDFAGSGTPQQILTHYLNGQNYPLASVDQLMTHIPTLREGHSSYQEVAGKTFEALFPAVQRKAATVLKAQTFASTLLLNDGQGHFSRKQLPGPAQFSPIYATHISDLDGDGHPDLLTGGNFSGVTPDEGRYDASYGEQLLGDGRGAFQPVSFARCGLDLSGEVRGMAGYRAPGGKRRLVVARNNDTPLIFEKTGKAGRRKP